MMHFCFSVLTEKSKKMSQYTTAPQYSQKKVALDGGEKDNLSFASPGFPICVAAVSVLQYWKEWGIGVGILNFFFTRNTLCQIVRKLEDFLDFFILSLSPKFLHL